MAVAATLVLRISSEFRQIRLHVSLYLLPSLSFFLALTNVRRSASNRRAAKEQRNYDRLR